MKNKLIIFIFFMILILGTASREIPTDCDFGWQVKAGQWMTDNNKILNYDRFSWLDQKQKTTWYNQEWIAEVIMYAASLSPVSYFVLGLLLSAAVNAVVLSAALRNKKYGNGLMALILLFLAFVFRMFFVIRPSMAGLLVFAAEVYIWEYLREKPGSRVIYVLPLIAVLWINIHGGSAALFYITAAVYILTRSIRLQWGRLKSDALSVKYIIRYAVVTAVSVGAMFINPYGYKMLLYPYINIADSQMLRYVKEWHAPAVNVWPDTVVFLLIALLLGSMFIQDDRKIDITDLTIAGLGIVMSLVSFRHIMFLWAVSFFILFKYLPAEKAEGRKGHQYLYFMIFVDVLLLAAGFGSPIEYKPYLSDEMTEMIKEYEPERIYNTYNTGGYLIYQDIPVFMDGRYELYAETVFKDYLCIENMNEGADLLLDQYRFDSFLVYEGSDIECYLHNRAQYRLVCKDNKEGLCFYISRGLEEKK